MRTAVWSGTEVADSSATMAVVGVISIGVAVTADCVVVTVGVVVSEVDAFETGARAGQLKLRFTSAKDRALTSVAVVVVVAGCAVATLNAVSVVVVVTVAEDTDTCAEPTL